MMETKWELCLGETTTCGAETITKFISESQIYTRPNVVSATAGDNFSAIAVDNLLAAIYDQDVCCVNIKSTIEDIAILAGGYIAVGEKNGTLTIGVFDGAGQFKVKQSCLLIPDAARTTQKTFAQILFQVTEELETESRARIICLSYQGVLMIFDDIILLNGDIDLSQVKQGRLSTPHYRALHFATMQDRIISVGVGSQCVALYAVNNGQLVLEDTASLDCEDTIEMMKVQILPKANVFISMDSMGKFYVWDAYTMMMVHTWTVPDASDFKLIQVERTQSCSFRLSDLKLVVVQQGKVQTLTLPSLTVASEHSCGAEFAILSKCYKSLTKEEVYVAECNRVEDEDGAETTVYFRCYREISPQKRLQRLIAKKRYEEAEKFAKMFGLPFNLDPLIVQSKMREVQETFSETAMHILQCKEKLLKNKSGDSSVAMVLSELQEMEHRLESYRLVYGEENYSPLEWEMFQYENPLVMCSKLVMADAEKAFKLWACFQENLQKQLKPGLVQKMLQKIPSSVPCQMVVDWLCQAMIPFIVTTDPKAVTNIIQWMEDRVRILEMNDKKTWLDDATRVCQTVLDRLQQAVTCDVDDITDNNLQAVKTKMNCELALSPLRALIKLLHGLKELKTKYKCHLSLDVFRKETKESITYRMLDSVLDVRQLPSVLSEQVLIYLKHNAIDPDEIFAKYIQDLLKRLDSNRTHSLLEDKIQALIKIIGDPKVKITTAVNLLENATLPLSEFIKGLVSEIISTVHHPLVPSLTEKWNMKEADNIVFQYGLDPKKVNTIFEVHEAAKYIVNRGGQVGDAQKILLAHKIPEEDYKLATLKCSSLIERNQLVELAQYLKLLQKKTAKKCCNHIICTGIRMMEDGSSSVAQKVKTTRLQYYEAAMTSASYLKSLTDDWYEREQVDNTIQPIKNAWQLEVFYKIYVNSQFLWDKLKCKTIFSVYIQTLNSTTLIDLGKLLNLENSDILEAMISKHSDELQSKALTKLLRNLAGLYGTFGSMPTSLAFNVLTVLSSEDASFSQCLKLAQLYLTTLCSRDKYKTAIQVCQQAEILSGMSTQGLGRISIEARDLLDVGPFQDVHLSLKSGKTLSNMVETAFKVTGDDEPLDNLVIQLEAFIEDLWKADQHELALRVLLLLSHRLKYLADFLTDDEKQYCVNELEKMMKMAKSTLSSLIVKILNVVPMDNLLAQAHILTLSKEQSIPLLQSTIKSCWNNYPKLKRVSMVACAIAEIMGDQTLIDSSQGIKVIAKWGNRLSKIGIPFRSNSVQNISEAMEAVCKLVQSPHCDVQIIIEFFRDFNLDSCKLDSTLMDFFRVCLTVHSEHGLSPAVLRKAEDALSCFEGHSLPLLKKVLQATHPYNYEVLHFVLLKIDEREESKDTLKGLSLLRYLQFYKRCSPPCAAEKKKCSHVFDESGDLGHSLLPDEASYRLPFHLLQQKDSTWEVISAEFNSQTLGLWLEMAAVLSMPRDNILFKTATNMIDNYIKSSAPSTASSIGDRQEFRRVLAQIDTVLLQLEDKEKAILSCHDIFNKLTNVEEKAIALQRCVFYCNECLNSTDEPKQKEQAKKHMELISRKHQHQSTIWALCRGGLDKERALVKLIKEPGELIQQLYLLPCVIEEQKDINTLCDEIADLHKVNVLDVRKVLLDKWLVGTSLSDSDQTLTFDVFPEADDASVQDNISRSIYVLKSSNRTDLLQYVARIASLEDGSISSAAQKKAVYCVLKVGTDEEIQYLLDEGI